MLLTVWAILVGLCLVLIVVGLARPTESAQALIGFFLLFLLSLSFLNSGLDYKTGYTESYDYLNISNPSDLHVNTIITTDNYTTYENHNMSLWLTFASAIGFIGVIFSLAKIRWSRE